MGTEYLPEEQLRIRQVFEPSPQLAVVLKGFMENPALDFDPKLYSTAQRIVPSRLARAPKFYEKYNAVNQRLRHLGHAAVNLSSKPAVTRNRAGHVFMTFGTKSHRDSQFLYTLGELMREIPGHSSAAPNHALYMDFGLNFIKTRDELVLAREALAHILRADQDDQASPNNVKILWAKSAGLELELQRASVKPSGDKES